MKILMVSTATIGTNGVSKFVLSTINHLSSLDVRYDLIVPNKPSPEIEKKLNKINCNVFILPNRNKKTLQYFFKIFKILKKGKYDIVHINGNSTTMSIELLAAKIAGCKIRIAHSHNTTCTHQKANRVLRPLFEKVCNGRIACSEEAGKWLFNNKRFTVIENGIVLDNYVFSEEKRLRLRKELDINNNDLVLVNVGRLNKQKNQSYLFKLVSNLKETKLLLVGNGPYEQKLKNEVEKLGLENKVIFCGAVKNVNDYLMAADIFLLPSLYEGMPFSLVEALATGLPVLVSKNLQPSTNITGNVNYLSLEDDETWLKSINKNITLSRTTLCKYNQKKLFEKGYDLNENLNKLYNFYCEKLSDFCEILKK